MHWMCSTTGSAPDSHFTRPMGSPHLSSPLESQGSPRGSSARACKESSVRDSQTMGAPASTCRARARVSPPQCIRPSAPQTKRCGVPARRTTAPAERGPQAPCAATGWAGEKASEGERERPSGTARRIRASSRRTGATQRREATPRARYNTTPPTHTGPHRAFGYAGRLPQGASTGCGAYIKTVAGARSSAAPGASAVWRAGAGGRGQAGARAKRPCGFSTVSRRTVASSTPAARRAGRKSVSR